MKKLKKLLSIFVSCLLICALTASFTACEGGNENEGGGSAGRETSQTDETARGEAAGGDASEAEETLNVLVGLSVKVGQAKTFGIGEAYSSDNITVMATISSDGNPADYDVTEDAVIDSGEFDNTEPGTYPIYISYTFGAKTLYTFYNVTVSSQILGTIAGLELAYDGERQFEVAAEGEAAPAIDLSKLTVSKHEGADANSAQSTPLASGDYALGYSVNGGELVAVEEGAASIPVTQRGVYSVYAEATHTSGSETFEMSGFVTFFAVDPLVSVEWNGDGTKEFEYDTDAEIGADWTYTATYASGATAQLGYADVETEGIANDNEGANTATVTYSEEQLGFDAVKNDAVKTAYSAVCEVVYTIGENPDAGQQVTDTFTVNFSDAAWSDAAYASGGTAMPFNKPLPVGKDGVPGNEGGIVYMYGKDGNSNFYVRSASASGSAAGYANEFYMGAIELSSHIARRAIQIDLSKYDNADITVVWRADNGRGISLFTDEAVATAADAASLRESGYMDSPDAVNIDEMLTYTFTDVAGGDIYYLGGNNNTVYIYEITIVANIEGAAAAEKVTEINAGDLEQATFTSDTDISGDGTVVITATADKSVAIDGNKKTYNGITFTQRIKLGGTGSATERSIKITTEGAATITVYALSSSGSEDRNLNLYDGNFTVMVNDQVAQGKPVDADLSELTYTVDAAGTYYLASADGGINVYYIKIVETVASAPALEDVVVNISDIDKTQFNINEKDEIAEPVDLSGDGAITAMASEGKPVKITDNEKSIDGFSFTQRLQLNGQGTATSKSLKITTEGAATITVYGMSGSSNTVRPLALYDSAYMAMGQSFDNDGNAIAKFTYTVDAAGTYFLGSTSGFNIYYIAIEY